MYISLLFFIFAGILDAMMDVLKTRWNNSIFSLIKNKRILNWIGPNSWQNKWKNGDYTQGEKFWGSSTVFVWLTDLWHFAKMGMILSLSLGAVFYTPLYIWYVDALLLLLAFTGTFQLFFARVFVYKK